MTSKERVAAALAHQPTDRVPIDYTANAGPNQRMLDYFGLAKGQNLLLRDALGVDFARVPLRYTGPHRPSPGRTGVPAGVSGKRLACRCPGP